MIETRCKTTALWDRWRRSAISVLIVLLLYQNVDALLGSWNVRLTLPNARVLESLFYMYGVFGRITTHAKGYLAYGSTQRLNTAPQTRSDSS